MVEYANRRGALGMVLSSSAQVYAATYLPLISLLISLCCCVCSVLPRRCCPVSGEYKYGWHALPRQFKCGAKIVSGRASCEYGIRRRSTDAFNVRVDRSVGQCACIS